MTNFSKKKKKKKTLQSNPKVIENPFPEFKSALCISVIWNCKVWSKICNNREVIDMIILLNSIEWPKKLVLNKSKTYMKITSQILANTQYQPSWLYIRWYDRFTNLIWSYKMYIYIIQLMSLHNTCFVSSRYVLHIYSGNSMNFS